MSHVLVFDFDGVLVDSLDIFMPAFMEACRSEGVSSLATEDDFFRLLDDNLYQGMMNRGMSRDAILRVVMQVKEALLRNWDSLHLFPGMAETVQALAPHNRLVVVTSNETALVEQFLASHDLSYFQEVIGSDQEPVKTTILASLQRDFPCLPCYYIGDTIGDIREGQRAGVKTVGVTWGWHGLRVSEAQPDHLVHQPVELVTLFAAQPSSKKDKNL